MADDQRLSRMEDKLDKVLEGLNETKVTVAEIKTSLNHIREDVKTIKSDVKDLPAIRQNVSDLKEGKKWWEQYLLAPISTGLIVGIVLLIAKKVFNLI